MLDLKIRDGSGNRKSLDDVMRGLYRNYYAQKKRGFTDAEFRAECEGAADTCLGEMYGRYFALAGLKLQAAADEVGEEAARPSGWWLRMPPPDRPPPRRAS